MINGNQMASGGGVPPQAAGGAPQDQARVAPGAPTQGGPDPQAIMKALAQAVQQSVDQEGFVDMNKLVEVWPQVAQQAGIDIPFEAILAMLQSNPEILESLIQELGLAGMIIDGQKVTGEMLGEAGASSEASGQGAPVATAAGAATPPAQMGGV